MVNAQEWINQNYPIDNVCQRKEDKENQGKMRWQIVNLDISKQNLEGDLGNLPGWNNLRKLNVSYNPGIGNLVGSDWTILEEIDYSYNRHGNDWAINAPFFQLRKLNLSYNNIERIGLFKASHLTHLNCTNNLLTELDLRKNGNLQVLECSGNPLNNLSLTYSPNLTIFNCFGSKLIKEESVIVSAPLKVQQFQTHQEQPPK